MDGLMKKQTFSQHITGPAAALAALALLIFVLSMSRGEAQSMPQPQATPSDPQVQKLNQMLQRTDLSDETRRNLEEKRIMAERMALESIDPDPRPVEERGPKVPPPLAQPLMVEPAPELWEGIFEGSEGLVRPGVAQINNGWQGRSASAEYQVFAGSTPVEPFQGVLLVARLDNDLPTAQRETYFAPEGSASLTILDVQDTRLLLETDTGQQLYFDLIERQFSSAQ